MKRSVRLLTMLAAAMLLLGACSTAEEAGQTETEAAAPAVPSEPAAESEVVSEPAPVETSEPATDPDAGAAGQTLLEVAEENPELSQLVQALQAAGLTDVLEEAGPLTLFAPNNDAFAQLDQGDLGNLLADPAQIGDILQYHVVEGAYPTSELSDGDTLPTLAGPDLDVSVDGSTVTVGGAEVVRPDIEAGNGVIHIIDQVLQP